MSNSMGDNMDGKAKASLRRAAEERQKQRVRRHWNASYAVGTPDEGAVVGMRARTRTPCSCYLCGNERRVWGTITRQEHRAAYDEAEQYDEAGVGVPHRPGRAPSNIDGCSDRWSHDTRP